VFIKLISSKTSSFGLRESHVQFFKHLNIIIMIFKTKQQNTYTMNDVAKILDLGFGRNTMYEKLRDKLILNKQNVPYQQYLSRDLFKLHAKKRSKQFYKLDYVTIVTEKGLEFIRKILTSPDPTFTLNSIENEQ
jgi:hypothetical protein